MKGGMIIRLIDVVMLLLFGFITVSDIVQRTQVPLPAKAKKKTVQKDTTEVVFSVIGVEIVPTKKIDRSNLQAITAQLEELGKKWQKQEGKKTQKELSQEFCKYIVTTGAVIRKGNLIEDNAVSRPIVLLTELERAIKRAYHAGI
ncbi:MAG: hypothetical protein ONB05_09325, partial [candidate division KSB1 bacterium]|nr:hypothetical protein [candidate division KSB1 bacterium]